MFGWNGEKTYICSVFFIVLDLRLTKVGVRRDSFFLHLSKVTDTFRQLTHELRLSSPIQTKAHSSYSQEYPLQQPMN